MFAIATGTLEEVVSTLDAGADPNAGDGYFDRPLSWAMFRKSMAMTKLLLARGANPNTGIFRAARLDDLRFMRLLVAHGADIHYRRELPLELATRDGLIPVVKYLLGQGAKVSARNQAALTTAVECDNKRMVELLLKCRARLNSVHGTVLLTAVPVDKSVERVRMLIQAGTILPLLDSDMATHLENQMRREDFDFVTGTAATAFTGKGVEFADGGNLKADLILLCVGVKAEVELAKSAGLEIGITGGVKTNGRMESSDPDIYAVGDAAEIFQPLPRKLGSQTAISSSMCATRMKSPNWGRSEKR